MPSAQSPNHTEERAACAAVTASDQAPLLGSSMKTAPLFGSALPPLNIRLHSTLEFHFTSRAVQMLSADALLPEGATPLEIPSDRPANLCHFKGPKVPAAATALYCRDGSRAHHHHAGRIAYACITPPCGTDPEPFIRRVFRTLALDLQQNFQFLRPALRSGDILMSFRRPCDREAAMRRQPFQLDGVAVKLVPVEMVTDVSRGGGYMVHAARHDYPVEQRTGIHTADNCRSFGLVREIDRACFAAPDLSTVRVILQVEHPRAIPRELRIYYDDCSASVVPIEIVRVWDWSHSYDANGKYSARPNNED
uniref:Uncharacterized protein n=1 Tax=Aegilops tauschii TaxID=37682 RepID=R7W3X4_AEGTA